jgi:hypothetical protein
VSKLKLGILCFAAALTLGAPGAAWAGAIVVPANVPYASEGIFPENVRRECTRLGTNIGTFIKQYADQNGTAVELSQSIDFSSAPASLRVEIVNVVSAGNAFVGHNKSMSVTVELLSGGRVTAKNSFSRNSMGGFGAGFKGSCAVLGRVTKALGKDIAEWLKQQ